MSHKKLITEFHEAIGGDMVFGKWGSGPFLVLKYKGFELVYDYYVVSTGQSAVTYSRMRTLMRCHNAFELKVSKEGVFAKLGKILGAQDIQIGDEFFDEKYMIKSNDEVLASRLLNNHEIKSRFNFNHNFNLHFVKKDSLGLKAFEGQKGLGFYSTHLIKHQIELENLIELFKYIIDELLEMDVITEGSVEGVLYKAKG